MIPFSPPHIDQKIIDEVINTLKSGWISSGPKTKKLEQKLAQYVGIKKVLCLNSATAGLELMLRWFGVKEGDEVIVPAYTYCATANVVIHCGATPVIVDVNKDFNISIIEIEKAITQKTKVIMPVDFAGLPCDYDAINNLVNRKVILKKFSPSNIEQKKLNRILILSDAAHSIGASYNGKKTGALADISVFSFHAVKNLTTAEGGAACLNLPEPFDNEDLYKHLCIKSLHGQTKDALAKIQKGGWEYDVIEAGYKYNMPDVLASIGLVELSRYDNDTLGKRKKIFNQYSKAFSEFDWAQLPTAKIKSDHLQLETSYHLYPLRIKNISEQERNKIVQLIFEHGVAVNVHFKPLPLLSLYKNLDYKIKNFPVAYDNYSREISLPVYYNLTFEQLQTVIEVVINAVKEVI